MPGLNRFLGFYLLIGLIQGIVFFYSDQLYRVSETLFFVTCTVVLVGGTTLQLLGEKVRQWRSLLPTLAFTLLMGGMTLWVCYGPEHVVSSRWAINSWFISLVLLSYVCASFLFAWPAVKGQRWRYEDLFQQAWNSVFIVLYALILVGLFMLLLKLWSRLFLMLGIEFFERHFWSQVFLCFSLPLVFALGMYLAARSEKVIGQMRGMLFSACGLLLPLIALISVLFTLTLPFTGLDRIWATGYSTPILLVLAGAQLFLLNGVFQQGVQTRPYPKWLTHFIELSLLCLPVLAALAFYSSWLRVEQYALSPQRFVALALALLCGLYGLAAVWAVALRSPAWLGNLRVTNPALALLFCVLLVLINTPLLNPVQLSVDDQVRRLLDGRTKAEAFDAHYLRFGLEKAGEEAYAKLQVDLDQERILDPDARRALRERMDDTSLSFSEQYAKERARRPKPELEWIGPKPKGSEQFAEISLNTDSPCEPGCVLWAVDLDQDGQNEVLVVPRTSFRHDFKPPRIYALDGKGEWDDRGPLVWTQLPDGNVDTETLINDIREGRISLVKPRYRQLQSSDMLLTPVIREP
ncbi:DUF4153 domain-containing protein [Pseudomonas sp. FW306-02-F02-AA]|uniref:DUF4153 domain-containing protein n=1 Tax=Pseudomonas fluorescens TaxID=294 RepID=A0A0N9WFX4_PSEFL|nr:MULTISPECIES: DUF4153 domain-containing protein [Pseudomonas]ALI01065.1 hypothetical protein AO353_08340 [Pseudomonas fluorescens]PMZ02613.1 DUF4153 domain-containing protein [Pseudomonas sp. FW306-02-F02-AB]PMZ09910.1 DUF4153 domain-containing protein [Pseudomonas sp. FW306-02-H06C]PMZ16783.1 DUF4153 domain-containing protein [Pseudomonas sp. FW306-02-F02-AA]PMZ23712.1 DUF4153 domain-containing protein [Pseudomonas sp. FW306-02-F08-AA]